MYMARVLALRCLVPVDADVEALFLLNLSTSMAQYNPGGADSGREFKGLGALVEHVYVSLRLSVRAEFGQGVSAGHWPGLFHAFHRHAHVCLAVRFILVDHRQGIGGWMVPV